MLIAVLAWMPSLNPDERSFWFWVGLRFTFLPFSMLFTAVLIISYPYKGIQPSQITSSLATSVAVITVFFQPSRSMDAENTFVYNNFSSSQRLGESFMYMFAFGGGSAICLLRAREIKNNQYPPEVVYHIVLKKLLPLKMSLVLMMLYFVSPMEKCLAQYYLYWNVKNRSLITSVQILSLVKNLLPDKIKLDLTKDTQGVFGLRRFNFQLYSPALLTVCLIFFLFAIFITPFSNKRLNSNSTESDAENDSNKTTTTTTTMAKTTRTTRLTLIFSSTTSLCLSSPSFSSSLLVASL